MISVAKNIKEAKYKHHIKETSASHTTTLNYIGSSTYLIELLSFNHICSVFVIMIRTESSTCITALTAHFISPNCKYFIHKNWITNSFLNLYKLSICKITFRVFILDRLRLEPEKLCARLRFASYTSCKGLHFCCRTLINFPQLCLQWFINPQNFNNIQHDVTIFITNKRYIKHQFH